jgi:hypothetical protein
LNEKSHPYSDDREKRRYPMILIGLPVDLERSDKPNAGSGFVIHASAACLRVQAFDDIPLSKKINIKASFPTGTEYHSFRIETEIVWKDVHFWEAWEEYHYALKFVQILNSRFLKFKRLLCRRSSMEEAPI